MSIDNLTNREKEAIRTQEGAFTVIIGYLKQERNKVAPSVFNKLATKLGYPKQKKEDLIELGRDIQERDAVLNSLYQKAFHRKIRLDDIPNAVEEEDTLKEKDVFSYITNYLIENEDNNARLRELRKLQREGVYTQLLLDSLKKDLSDELQGMPRAKYLKTEAPKPSKGDRKLILCFSDWHVGVLVYNENTGGYNFEKLRTTVNDVINETLKICQELDIKEIVVLNLGDFTEHINLRNVNQAYDAEMNLSQQITKSIRLTVDMLSRLSKEIHVTYSMISGNHDRLQANKTDVISGDTTAYIILDQLFFIQEVLGQIPNVDIVDNRNDIYSTELNVAGKTIKAVHGDNEKKNDTTKIHKHIKDYPIDILFMGHYHYTSIIQEDYARFTVTVGSPQGENDYSKSLNLPSTYGTQMITILEEGKESPIFYPLAFKNGRLI